jgi:hypothetical protein
MSVRFQGSIKRANGQDGRKADLNALVLCSPVVKLCGCGFRPALPSMCDGMPLEGDQE